MRKEHHFVSFGASTNVTSTHKISISFSVQKTIYYKVTYKSMKTAQIMMRTWVSRDEDDHVRGICSVTAFTCLSILKLFSQVTPDSKLR